MQLTRTTRHLSAALVVALTLALIAVPSASAHATFVSSSPARNAKVTSVRSVSLTFNSALKTGSVSVKGPGGTSVTSGASGRDPRNVKRLLVALKSGLKLGKYTVSASWTAADGHKASMSYSFTLVKKA